MGKPRVMHVYAPDIQQRKILARGKNDIIIDGKEQGMTC